MKFLLNSFFLAFVILFAKSAHAQWKVGSCTETSISGYSDWADEEYINCSVDGVPLTCENPYGDEPNSEPCYDLFTKLDQQHFQNASLCTKTRNNIGITISCQPRVVATPAPPASPAPPPAIPPQAPANTPVTQPTVQPVANNQVQPRPSH